MFIPRGNYLTVEQYRQKIGATRDTILKAIKDGRLQGVIRMDARTILIPRDAVLINRTIKTGKYIGLNAWIKGEVEHQEEVKNWEMKQAQLRKKWDNDIKDPEDSRGPYDYD